MFPEQVHKSFYFGGLLLLAISLPFSIFILSVAQITLMVNWILEGKFKQKWELIKQRPSLWAIALFYLVHVLWMANTSDIEWGLHDLRIKLPMLIIPLVIGTSQSISNFKFRFILHLFVGAVFTATLISAYYILEFDGQTIHSVKEYSRYVSHITWSIMVSIAIFISFWLLGKTNNHGKWLFIPLSIWFIVYLFLLQALTGIAIFILTVPVILFRMMLQNKNLMLRWFLTVLLLTFVLVITSYITRTYARFHTFEKIDIRLLDKFTEKGNPYFHDTKSWLVENGRYVNIYVCEPEMSLVWNRRSSISYDGQTITGEELKRTLARYLTSKGFRKDSAAVEKLTDNEIKYIEQGKTNHIDTAKYSLYLKMYVAWWELYNYKNGANPTGYSISQRLEFIKTASHIIKKNTWFGVGTGDIKEAFANQYEEDKSPLAKSNRFRTHNQLVTFVVTFGISGFILIMMSLLLPPWFERKYSNYLFLIAFVSGFLSFINEDTLETHQGISLFAFFYSLFLFLTDETTNEKNEITNKPEIPEN